MLITKVIQGIVGVSLGLGLSACNTLYVKTDANPELSVASCHTYAFAHEHVTNADAPGAQPFVQENDASCYGHRCQHSKNYEGSRIIGSKQQDLKNKN